MLGTEPRDPLPKPPRGQTFQDVQDAMYLPALSGGRCLVSFSGGRDSSFALASVTAAARRHGLPDPVPITLRVASVPEAEETFWQEEVIAHLGLEDWERIEVHDELNLVGPWAQTALRRHGQLFPSSCFMLLPMLERAEGGTLVVAQGAGEMDLYWRWRPVMDLLALRTRPRRENLKLMALALTPVPLRRKLMMKAAPPAPFPWVRGEAALEISRIFASEVGTEPIPYSAALRGLLRHRCMTGTIRSIDALAGGTGAKAVLPVLDPRLLAMWAREGGWKGFGDRTQSIRRLAGHLLPESVIERRDRTRINRIFFGRHTRDFAERWSGDGLDTSIVDPEVLREIWLGEDHDWRTGLLMQAAWLHEEQQTTTNRRSSHGEQAAVAGA